MSLKYVKKISEPGSNLPDEVMTPEEAARQSAAEGSQPRSEQAESAGVPQKSSPDQEPPAATRDGRNPLERDEP